MTSLPLDEADLIDALTRRDEAAFVQLVTRYQAPLLRLALVYAGSRAVAEEIVQETWLGVLQGIERFEGRSSFKTWLFRILVNRAKSRGEREGRTTPFSALEGAALDASEPALPADRFLPPDHPEWPSHWAVPPRSWGASPEEQLLQRETLALAEQAIALLPPAQREVITLRDVEGASSEDVCNVLGITETNQRVLLHRARSRVRAALERHLEND
ncbi:MAG: RNA polymerase sigma factor [Gemmatimonadaceae bacterium]